MPEQNVTEGIRILVVDDEAFNQALLEDMLKDLGHQVLLASSGEEGLALFREQQPDLVLMDVMLPGMSGFDTVRAMRRVGGLWVPIIFITSLQEVGDMVQSIQSGGDDYLLKPLNSELLRAKINALNAHRLLEKKLSEHNRELLAYRARAIDESQIAQEFIGKVTALDTAHDPDVQFHLHPAEHYSGDLIAFGRTPSGQLHVMLADSTGHGLAAALNVMPILQPFYTMTAKGFSIGKIAAEINRTLKEYLPQHRFVAAILAAVDSESHMVQVWNGGMPPAVLLKPDAMVAYQFDSHHLPLGILGQQEFDNRVEQFFYGKHDCQLFMCSDGAVDSVAPEDNMMAGMLTLLRATRHEQPSRRLLQARQEVERHLQGRPAFDDIALMMVNCPGDTCDASGTPMAQTLAQDVAAMQRRRAKIAPAMLQAHETDWQVEMKLGAMQLRKADVIPVLLLIVNNLETQAAKLSSSLFVTVSELFNNALDHGVLQLDSSLKQNSAGMELYFDERASRLKNLDRGEINIRLEKFSAANNEFLKITFRDSGQGFDHATRLRASAGGESVLRHGRGIALMLSLCYSLRYIGKGNEVEAVLLLDDAGS
ncbi:MAG TPA: fused response regulator/phosphatase [Gallionellaceae bacterium]|nr:fused response regulator/phosphatase [Gallionellaceae bacterium]